MQHNAMWTLFIISIISSFHGVTPLFRARIPIGAIFDDDSLASHSAFRYEIEKHNNNSKAVYKIDRYEKIVNVDDNYQLINAICSTLNRGVFTFFSMAGVKALSSVDSLASKYNIPILHPSSPHIQAFKCKDNSGVAPESTRSRSNPCAVDRVANDQSLYNIRMLPAYHRAIIDLIVHYQWRTVYYLYDTDSGLYRLPHIFDAIRRRKLRVELEVVRVADSGNSYALLRELDKKATREQEKYFVLDISDRDSMRSILTQIQNVGMNRLSYHYLLGGMIMDELDLKDFIHGGVNISGFRMVNPQSRKVIQKINEWKNLHPNRWNGIGKVDKIKLDVALTIDAVQVVSHALKRLVLTKGGKLARAFRHGQMYNNGTLGIRCNIRPKYSGSSSASTRLQVPFEFGNMINNEIKKVSFHGLTGKLNFDAFGQRTDYSIDVLELSQFRNPRKIGVWSSRAGLNIERQTMVPRLSSSSNDSRPSVRIITSIISAPYLMHRKEPEEGGPLIGNDRFEGFCAELAKKVADIVGFEYLIQLVADDKYGSMLDDGNWNGMVGELSRNKADLAVAPLTITSMRERLIDFSKPFMSLGISIMIKKPEKQKPGVFSFMDPLSYEIWMYVILAYVVVSVTLFLVSRFSPYEWHVEDSQQGAAFTNDFTMLNSLWFSLGAIMRQGCDISPRSMSGRIVGGVWWFCTLILISSYTANLAAFLTVERMLTPIESADDLSKQSVIQYGTLGSGSTQNFFEKSQIPVYERMWDFMENTEPSVFVDKTGAGVERVRDSKGKYAFLLESTMNDYHNQLKPCNTMKVGGNLDSKGYGIATPLNSPLREQISVAVLQLRETGFLQKLHKKWWYDKGECGGENEAKGSKQSALTLSNVAGVFYILIGGLALSMVTSIMEFVYKSQMEAQRQRKNYAITKFKFKADEETSKNAPPSANRSGFESGSIASGRTVSPARVQHRSTNSNEGVASEEGWTTQGGTTGAGVNGDSKTVPMSRSSAVSLV